MQILVQPFAQRVLRRLADAVADEPDPWFRDDLKIAKLVVLYAARGDAVCCSPHELACYEVLGCHPSKVWPRIEAQRLALLGPSDAPPKKPVQSVKLWPSETSKKARAINSRLGCIKVLDEPATSVLMSASPSSAAYPNSNGPTSGKKGYTYDDFLLLLKRRGASHTVRKLLLDMVGVRGQWPKENGPISSVLCVSVKSIEDKTMLHRSTIQRRLRRAQRELCLRQTRDMNSWLNCPKCGSERTTRECPNPKCAHRGNGFDHREFRRTFTYEIDFAEIERRAAGRIGPIEIPRKPVQPEPEPDPPATAEPKLDPQRKTAEHHRSTERAAEPSMESRGHQRVRALRAGVLAGMSKLMSDGLGEQDALQKVCRTWGVAADEARAILKECLFEPPPPKPPKPQDHEPHCLTCNDMKKLFNPRCTSANDRMIPCPDCAEKT